MKPIRKLVIKNLLLNKTRTIVTIIGIILSVALITSIIGFISSGMTSVNNAKYSSTGDYEMKLAGEFDNDSVTEIKANRNVKGVYYQTDMGLYRPEKSKSERMPFVTIEGIDKATFEGSCCKLKEGRFPENENEIIISSTYGRYITKGVGVGDEVELEKIERHYKKEFILERSPDISDEYLELSVEAEIPGSVSYEPEGEIITSLGKSKFQVVGIMDYAEGFLGYDGYNDAVVFTYTEKINTKVLYVAFTDEGLSHFEASVSQITGIDENLVLNARSESDHKKLMDQLLKNTLGITGIDLNSSLLEAKNVTPTTDLMGTLIGIFIVGLLLLIVCGSCVFIIRNSFNISLNDKIKLFGMLSSTGATPNQLRMSVFFEAAILGLIGVPLGVLMGYAITGGLMAFANVVLGDLMGSFEIVFSIPYYAALAAAALGLGTVLMAAYNASVEASRVTPLEAIRSSKSVNIKKRRKGKKKEKDFKTPKFIKKLFGAGGSIAWKNMKRSRKQYRTTIISIVVSVALFITVACFVEKLILYTSESTSFRAKEYNLFASVDTTDINGKKLSIPEIEKYAYDILGMGETNKQRFSLNSIGVVCTLPMSEISDDLKSNPDALAEVKLRDEPDKASLQVILLGLDDETYASYCRKNGIDPEKDRDKAFLFNRYLYENPYLYKTDDYEFMKDPAGKTLKCMWNLNYSASGVELPEGIEDIPGIHIEKKVYVENNDEWLELEPGDPNYDSPDNYVDYYVSRDEELSLAIGGVLENDFSLDYTGNQGQYIAVSMDWLDKNVMHSIAEMGEEISSYMCPNMYLFINADSVSPNDMEDKIKDSGMLEDMDFYYFMNIHREITTMNSILALIQIIVYSFIVIISLIGITNIFNTITTNMRLRRKEFAMLRSIGMTKHEFNRLIQLESIMYTVKSLLIGLPLGLLGCWGVNAIIDINPMTLTPTVIPWLQIVISIVVVLVLLWTIMKFSVSKVRKMNIIETIRNDNI